MSQQPKLTLDQERAKYAWGKVERIGKQKEPKKEKELIDSYTSLAKSTPALIMGSGLMQTLSFLKAKIDPKKNENDQPHFFLLVDLLTWIRPALVIPISKELATHAELTEAFKQIMEELFSKTSSSEYMHVTNEAMALLRWIRQFADARKAMG